MLGRFLAVLAFIAATTVSGSAGAHEAPEHDVHKLAIQVSDNDPGTMTKVLNVVANAATAFQETGMPYEIEVVAFNAGLHLLRSDTSPVAERIANFPQSVPNVTFTACGNTLAGMTRKEGAEPPLFEFVTRAPAGVIRLMELNDQGYFVLHP